MTFFVLLRAFIISHDSGSYPELDKHKFVEKIDSLNFVPDRYVEGALCETHTSQARA